jgi:CBS domain containing-hemolysin-like protein
MGIDSTIMIIIACMAGSAFFSGMETGVISIHRMRLRHFVRRGSKGAELLQGYLDNSDRLLGTTLVGTNICVVVISVVSASMAVDLLGEWGGAASTVVMSVLVLVFSEYLPKAWFHSRPLERCRRFAGMLRIGELILKPLGVTIIWLTRWLVPGPSRPLSKPLPFVTREDLKVLAREGEKDGVLSREERDMIHRVFELSGKRAREIMVPLKNMTSVWADTTVDKFFETARTSGFTRMPVRAKDTGEFAGVINVFYVLSSPELDTSRKVADFVRPPLFVSENMPVDDILPRMRRSRQPMCFVSNDESEVVGLITTEDILEEIVGQL